MDIRQKYIDASEALLDGGLTVDERLHNSLWLTLIAKRSFMISTSNVDSVCAEVTFILEKLWDFQYQLIACDRDEDFLEFVASLNKEQDHEKMATKWRSRFRGVTVMSGIQRLPVRTQQDVLKWIRKLKSVSQNVDLFSVIAVVESDEVDRLDKFLVDILWFCNVYEPIDPQLFTMANEKYTSFTKLKQHSDTIRDVWTSREKFNDVRLILEIKRYVYDIIIFLRVHRMVVGGVKTYILQDVYDFVKYLAVVKGYDYAIPSMVKLAVSRILPFKLTLVKRPEDEPSLLYGSDIKLIREFVTKWNSELVVEDVLNQVQPPI